MTAEEPVFIVCSINPEIPPIVGHVSLLLEKGELQIAVRRVLVSDVLPCENRAHCTVGGIR